MLAVAAGKLRVADRTYRLFRYGVMIAAGVFAFVSVWRIATKVGFPRQIHNDFIPELVGYAAFWILIPPLWFFAEFYAADAGAISETPKTADELKKMKDYSDFASKIWAAVLAILALLISLKT